MGNRKLTLVIAAAAWMGWSMLVGCNKDSGGGGNAAPAQVMNANCFAAQLGRSYPVAGTETCGAVYASNSGFGAFSPAGAQDLSTVADGCGGSRVLVYNEVLGLGCMDPYILTSLILQPYQASIYYLDVSANLFRAYPQTPHAAQTTNLYADNRYNDPAYAYDQRYRGSRMAGSLPEVYRVCSAQYPCAGGEYCALRNLTTGGGIGLGICAY